MLEYYIGHFTLIYAVFIVCFFHITLIAADVVVKDKVSTTLKTFEDFPASFGPGIPMQGIKGRLIYVVPSDGCSPVDPPPRIDNATLWIALVARTHNQCEFSEKVLNTEKAGFNAAIIHNYFNNDDLVYMGTGAVGNEVNIPAVFVGWHSGQELSQHYQYNRADVYTVTIDPRPPFNVKNYLFPFAAVMGGCLLIGCVVMMGRSCRNVARRHRSRLPSRHLKKIPVKKFKKGESYDVCAICLDEYEEGDKLRVLPCAHAYHCKCIDPWLTKNKRTCPVCKRRVIPRDQDSASESDSEDDEISPTPTERTPLLGHSQSDNHGSTSRWNNRTDSSDVNTPCLFTLRNQKNMKDQPDTFRRLTLSPVSDDEGNNLRNVSGPVPINSELVSEEPVSNNTTSTVEAAIGAVGGISAEDNVVDTQTKTNTAASMKKTPRETMMRDVVASPPETDLEDSCIEVVTVDPHLPESGTSESNRGSNHVV